MREGLPVGDPYLRELTLELRPRSTPAARCTTTTTSGSAQPGLFCLAKPHNTSDRLHGVAVAERDRRGNLRILNLTCRHRPHSVRQVPRRPLPARFALGPCNVTACLYPVWDHEQNRLV